MRERQIWIVDVCGDPVTVIAETADEARELVIDYCDVRHDAEALEDVSGAVLCRESPTSWRWVDFESSADRNNMTRDLDAAGVEVPERILWRDTYRPGGDGGARWWGVGARNEDWCRLPAGVLCGGPQ